MPDFEVAVLRYELRFFFTIYNTHFSQCMFDYTYFIDLFLIVLVVFSFLKNMLVLPYDIEFSIFFLGERKKTENYLEYCLTRWKTCIKVHPEFKWSFFLGYETYQYFLLEKILLLVILRFLGKKEKRKSNKVSKHA